ncbi:peptide deformylase [Candidatus Saccharibacteria bacterium]|nr:peptide deformylase [Candidatus Saccharibacteria bacterium]
MIRKLVTIPDQLLRSKSTRIGHIDNSIQTLLEDMIDTTLDWDHDSEFGAALAAIQIGEPIKLTIVRNNFEDATDNTFLSFINPEIVQKSRERIVDIEGCLSVPGYYARIPRAKRIKVKAQTIDGEPVRLTLEDFAARVFQHEVDHMNGILFIDYIRSAKDVLKLGANGKLEEVNEIPSEILEMKREHGHH